MYLLCILLCKAGTHMVLADALVYLHAMVYRLRTLQGEATSNAWFEHGERLYSVTNPHVSCLNHLLYDQKGYLKALLKSAEYA